jgi:hypothetical protein
MEWTPAVDYGLFFWIWPNTKFAIHIPDSTSTTSYESRPLPMTLNAWHFFAASYNYNTGKLTMKVDSDTWTVDAPKMHARTKVPLVYIGRRYRSTSISESWYKGKMSCVMLFDQALTADKMEEARKYCLDIEQIRKRVGTSTECRYL